MTDKDATTNKIWVPPTRIFRSTNPYLDNTTLPAKCWSPGIYLNLTTTAAGKVPACLPCTEGHYCPTLDSRPVPCPAGFFCWSSAKAPQQCAHQRDFTWDWSHSHCPALTSKRPPSIEGTTRILLMIVGTVLLYMLKQVFSFLLNKVRSQQYKQWKLEQLQKMKGEKVVDGSFPPRPGVTFTYSNLSLTVKAAGKTKIVVDSVSGEVPAATMTAVMGPSGAGKVSAVLLSHSTTSVKTNYFSRVFVFAQVLRSPTPTPTTKKFSFFAHSTTLFSFLFPFFPSSLLSFFPSFLLSFFPINTSPDIIHERPL